MAPASAPARLQVRVRFGLDLDGARSWAPANRLGDATLGPLGFLNLLETQLGLLAGRDSHAERVVVYRGALLRVDSADRFFHRSLEADALGTAATLLDWRDTWCLHGWTGELPPDASARLRDVAAVEAALGGVLAPCMGERLARIAQALAARPIPIHEVQVVDPAASLPIRWRQVLEKLPTVYREPELAATPTGVLGEIQQLLRPVLEGGVPQGSVAWRDDGTLYVARAETRLLAAEWLRGPLRDSPGTTLIVADRHGVCLDESLARHGVARNGFRETSTLRPATQVLALAMELLWDPVDVGALVQFLTHPVCPLPRFAARTLAEKLVARPGIGGLAWREALAEIAAHEADGAGAVLAQIRSWVECERHPRLQGAPREAALARAEAIRQYLQDRLVTEDRAERAAFAAAYDQAAEVVRTLTALEVPAGARLMPRQLEQLLAQTSARGLAHPLLDAQLGAAGVAACPAAVIEPVDTLVWWQMAAPALPARYPWSKREIAQLRAAGVELPDLGAAQQALARTWLRPVLAARRQLILVLPPGSEEAHPLWLMLRDRVPGIPILPLESLLHSPLPATQVVPLGVQPLPARRRWWRLGRGAPVPLRATESYSGLNLFLNDPSQWVLQYPARLSRSPILAAPDRPKLFGNLAHRLVERGYRTAGAVAWDDAQLQDWFEAAFPRVIAEEGATLLMAGERAYLAAFRQQLRASMLRLQRALREAGVVAVEPEAVLAGRFDGGALTGSADLLVTRGDGRRAVIDMKWSGTTRYRDRLACNRHLQLVIYGACARDRKGGWPEVAYLILDQAELLARDRQFFPSARVALPRDAQNIDAVWTRIGATWRWRRDQVAAGEIEVVGEDVEPQAALEVPPEGFEVESLGEAYNAYRHLRGWSA